MFVPTSAAPWHPDTNITETAIRSATEMVGHDVRVEIYADAVDPTRTPDETDRYLSYLHALSRLGIGTVRKFKQWRGLAGMTDLFIQTLKRTDLVVVMQHDWEILGPERVDFSALATEMLRDESPVHYVRFHRKVLEQRFCSKYFSRGEYIPIAPPANLPLIASNGWGDSPHIATGRHYIDVVRHHMIVGTPGRPGRRDRPPDGRYGLERPCGSRMRTDINALGFRRAHAKWGSWFYGREGDDPYMIHRGRDQGRRRGRLQRNEHGDNR